MLNNSENTAILTTYDQEEIMAAMEAFDYSMEEAIEIQQNGGFIFYSGLSLIDVAYDLVDTDAALALSADALDCDTIAEELILKGYRETEHGVIVENKEATTANKVNDLQTVIVDGIAISYFFKREKNDRNGNPRFNVFIIDPEAPAVYETILKCYDSQIKERVVSFIEANKC